jgi:hypothetical protein
MTTKFDDYYEICGLDPHKSRENNYDALLKVHHEAGKKRGPDAELELLQLNKAMSIFKDVDRYQTFRAEWERRRKPQPKTEKTKPRANKTPEPKRPPVETGEQQARAAAEKARRSAEKAKPSFFKNLFNTGKCLVGAHKGQWFYNFPDQCVQIQICELCDLKSTRTEHDWAEWKYPTPGTCRCVRVCNRCGEHEYDVEHEWVRWEYVAPSDCTQVQLCGRCGESSENTRVVHQWSEWKRQQLDRIRTCSRCHETESEALTPSEPSIRSRSEAWDEPGIAREALSLSGVWVAGDGLPVHFQQVGNRVSLRGVNGFGVVVVQGQGVLQGHQLHLTFQYYDGYVYDQGRTIMQIAPNRCQMAGVVQYAVSGMQRPMQLVRQL